MCNTVTEQQCQTVQEEKCETQYMIKYESECQTVTRNECRTVYDTKYEQVDTDSLESALETKSEECQYEKHELVSL